MENLKNDPAQSISAPGPYDADPRDFSCRCGCGFNSPSPRMVELLNKLSNTIRERVIINSGCRCETHNYKVGGKPKSFHLTGEAADICSRKMDALTLGISAFNAGFIGIIVYKNFVHIDVRRRRCMELNVHLFDNPEEEVSENEKKAEA